MKPITVGVHVTQPRAEVFEFLDVLSNHEPFTDHMLVDWTCESGARGVGTKARMRANVPGREQWLDMEVVAVDAPARIAEEAIGADGKRHTRGTYTLAEAGDGGTDISFTLEYLSVPISERLAAPLVRTWAKRANAEAMVRLRAALAAAASADAPLERVDERAESVGSGE